MKRSVSPFALFILSMTIAVQSIAQIHPNANIRDQKKGIESTTANSVEPERVTNRELNATPEIKKKGISPTATCLTIYVKDMANSTLIRGVNFAIKDNTNKLVGQYTATRGIITIDALAYGTYTIVPVSMPDGYNTTPPSQSVILNNNTCKEISLLYSKPKTTVFKWDKDYPINAVRIGEYYWMDNNFNWTGNDPWNSNLFPSMNQTYLDTYMKCIFIDKSKYQVNINDFNKYYGLYVNHDGMFEISKYGSIAEDGKVSKDWKLPSYSDARQLFAMAPFNTFEPSHDDLNERDVRFALSAANGDNPMAFNFSQGSGSPYKVYWFGDPNTTNIYKFNLMPAGFRFVANNISWTNGLGNWTAKIGDIALLFYTAYFPVTDDNATAPYRMTGLASLHDSIDYIPFSWGVDNRYPFRWCRKLTDAELGYKLYVKADNVANWSTIANETRTKGEEPILRELINNRILPSNIKIVQLGLADAAPAGYIELPKGYIRGFYVQYFITNPNLNKTIENIINYALKVQDNYVRKLKEKTTAKAFSKIDIGDIVVYPNPVSNTLYVKPSNMSGVIDQIDAVKIYTLSGSLSYNTNKLQSNSVDISNLPEGVYIAKVWINGNMYTKKIIKKN